MSNFDKIRAALTKRFTDTWAGAAPTLTLALIGMPNHVFDRPNDSHYGKLSIQQGGRASAAIGATRIRSVGMVSLQVFLPENSGEKIATDAGDNFATVYDNQTIALLDASGYIRMGFAEHLGSFPREGYIQHNFSATYEQDENR
tara:strand:- start:2068 stop:2499 length:432 start_codon:yes stop_codon:yes gene_type:complete